MSNPRKYGGSLIITRWHGSKPPFSGITIRLQDETSGTTCVEVEITAEALGNALVGSSLQPCKFEWYPWNVGKVREHKVETISFEAKTHKTREEEAKAALVPYEVDGWKGSWRDLGNPHNGSKDGYRVGFIRFVDAQEATA